MPELTRMEFFFQDRQFFLRLAREGKTPQVVYDIGASSGGWSAIMNAGLTLTEHHLFEPLADHTQNSAWLQRRLDRHPGWVVHPIALSDSNGSCTISVGADPDNSTLIDMRLSSVISSRAQVTQWRLDDYVHCRNLPLPNLVKIDAQATEHRILAGGREAIGSASVLMVETWLYREYGPSTPLLTDIIELAQSLGFILFQFGDQFRDGGGRIYGVDVVFIKPGFLDPGKARDRIEDPFFKYPN